MFLCDLQHSIHFIHIRNRKHLEALQNVHGAHFQISLLGLDFREFFFSCVVQRQLLGEEIDVREAHCIYVNVEESEH